MKKKLYKLMNWPVIEGIIYHEEKHPFDVLGRRYSGSGTLFQTYYDKATQITLNLKDKEHSSYPMEMADENGFFALLLPGKITCDYEYEILTGDGSKKVIADAYRFDDFFISGKNNSLLNQGIAYKAYELLGAFVETHGKISGVRFALWAPCAESVCVTGSFNDFVSGMYPMQKNDDTDIYELFVPNAGYEDTYCYEIKEKNGITVRRADPYSKRVVMDGETVLSVICDDVFDFSDSEYARGKNNVESLSICEVDLCGFETVNGMIDIKSATERIIKHVNDFGYNCVKLLPFTESLTDHPSCDDTAFFYAVSSRVGSINDIKYLVNSLHENGTGVVFDFNCSRFSNNINALAAYDGSCLYEHLDTRRALHGGSNALNFNYSRTEVTDYLIANALYFITQCHFDGLCINDLSSMLYLDYKKNDGEWLPNMYGDNENTDGIEFIKHLNSIIKKNNKSALLIAEEDAAYPGITKALNEDGLGFDYKFNNGFSDDYMSYISFDPYFRAHHHNELTFSMVYQYSENFICGFGHGYAKRDFGTLYEQMPGEDAEKFANLKLTFAYLFMHPGKKMLMLGQDFGDTYTVGSDEKVNFSLLRKNTNKGLKNLVRELNKLYFANQALYESDATPDGFEWINCIDSNNCTLSFLRKGREEKNTLLVVCNFAGISRQIRVGTPLPGQYKELINTDDRDYCGTHMINSSTRIVSETEADSRPYSIQIKLAPLSLSVFKYIPFTASEKHKIEKKKEALIADSNAKKYKEEAMVAKLEYEEAKAIMEEAMERMNAAEAKVKEALENEKKELNKAKKAMDEAK